MNGIPSKSRAAVIVGLGRTGLSCARYLHARGWRLSVTDTRQAPPELARLKDLDSRIPVIRSYSPYSRRISCEMLRYIFEFKSRAISCS